MQHIVQEHIGSVLPKTQMVLPQSLDSERIEMLLSSPWKPLDLPAAVKLLCSQKKIQNTEFHTRDNMEDGDDCFQDACNDTSPEKEIFGDACNGCDENESEEGKMSSPFHLPDGWPISDDRSLLCNQCSLDFLFIELLFKFCNMNPPSIGIQFLHYHSSVACTNV